MTIVRNYGLKQTIFVDVDEEIIFILGTSVQNGDFSLQKY